MSTPTATRWSKTLGTGRDWRRRLLLHHAPLALVSAAVLAVFATVPAFATSRHGSQTGAGFIDLSTVGTGYLALGLLALTLLIGPANLVLRRRNPVSTYLRRDVGAWAAVASVVHVVRAFDGHGGGRILDFFVRNGTPLLDNFGLGNWTGLTALVIVLVLLALSTDSALRELKAKTWKDLQRLTYTLFALVVLHALFYGALSRATSSFTLLLILTVITVVAGQAMGVWLWRQRASASTRR
jgi:sulfoxide reductase heme-binding subunit YedZ